MKNWKRLLKVFGSFVVCFLIVWLGISVLSYFTDISSKVISFLVIFVLFGMFLLMGFKIGRNVESKGYIAGLEVGLGLVLIMFLLGGLFFGFRFKLAKFIYYGVLIMGSVLGAMIGINKKNSR